MEMEELTKFVKKFVDLNKMNFPFEDVQIIGKEYYLLNPKTKKLIEGVKFPPFSLGLPLARKGKLFEPSMALLQMLAPFTNKKVKVDSKSAWLFACGRDLFENSIVERFGDDSFVIVLNNKDEVLGYAVKTKDKGKILYKNVIDIGDYLRREK
jgi:ribosome biogenesis protein Nip4